METNILEKLGLPDDQEAIFGRQEQAKDEAIRYAISGLLDAKEKMEKQFGNYATMNAMVWLGFHVALEIREKNEINSANPEIHREPRIPL